MAPDLPTAEHAAAAARETLGWEQVDVSRFTTGLAFFVYEVRAPQGIAVIRMGRPEQRQALRDALMLSRQLRPLGVPLPPIMADGTDKTLPYLVMERLAGTDLGDVVTRLSVPQLQGIAAGVAAAQRAVTGLGPGSRYGYAPTAKLAPYASWSDVIFHNSLDRSHKRITANGLFDPGHAERLMRRFERLRPALDAIPALPFLHDTTTKNVIIAPDGSLSGIVDVDDLCFGDPRFAMALTRAALIAFYPPSPYADIWQGLSGLANDAITAFYTPLFLLDFMAEQGMVFNGNTAPANPEHCNRLEQFYIAAMEQVE